MFSPLASVFDPDHLGEIGLLLHSGAEESYFWNQGDSLEVLLSTSVPNSKG
jgi:hypothetical protein